MSSVVDTYLDSDVEDGLSSVTRVYFERDGKTCWNAFRSQSDTRQRHFTSVDHGRLNVRCERTAIHRHIARLTLLRISTALYITDLHRACSAVQGQRDRQTDGCRPVKLHGRHVIVISKGRLVSK